jgi:hypothetical protein
MLILPRGIAAAIMAAVREQSKQVETGNADKNNDNDRSRQPATHQEKAK